MKKFLITTLILSVCPLAIAEINMPGAPTMETARSSTSPSSNYKKINYSTNTANPAQNVKLPETAETKDPKLATLNSLAMSVLKAAEKRDNETQNKLVKKMMENGAEGFTSPQIISKRTPQCPPIRIKVNGKTMSGSTCAMFGYLYKDKQYDVGYCK